MFKKIKILTLIAVLALKSCDLKDNKAEPEKSFIRIYENGVFNQEFYPLCIVKTTEDNGYLILGKVYDEETDFLKATIIKLDNQGNSIYSKISNDIFNPTDKIFFNGTNYYFVSMDEISLNARLVKADTTFETLAQIPDTYYTLAANKIDNELYIMGYDPLSRQTTLTKTNEIGGLIWKSTFEVYEDVQKNIFEHLLLRRRPFPFFIAEAGNGHIAMNGLNNFTLSVTYVNKNNGQQTGILNGVRYEYGISALSYNTQNNSAAISRHSGNGNHIFTGIFTHNLNGIGASKDIAGLELPEFAPFAKVVIKSGVVKGKNINLFASNTKSGQIQLIAFDAGSGNIIGSIYLGGNTLYEIGDIWLQDDEIVVLGKVQAGGRFGRIFVNKLSQKLIEELLRIKKK